MNLNVNSMRTCSIENCNEHHEARGYCNKHYLRYKRFKDPLITKLVRIEGNFEDYFWNCVDKSGDCWLWNGKTFRGGYGRVSYRGKTTDAHRVAYELANDEKVPEKLFVLHSCDNPPCCNPEHLRLGTKKENAEDREERNRVKRLKGESSPNAVLTNRQVIEMRKLNLTPTETGKKYKICRTTASAVLKRKTWKHL